MKNRQKNLPLIGGGGANLSNPLIKNNCYQSVRRSRIPTLILIVLLIFSLVFTACPPDPSHTHSGVEWKVSSTAYPAQYSNYCSCGAIIESRNVELGDTGPGGGKIYFIADGQDSRPNGFTMTDDNSTAHYLEVAPADSGTAQWGDYGFSVSNVTTFSNIGDGKASIVGNGRKDTALIAAHMEGKSITGRAAQLADSYENNGKDDWFLPSSGELNLLYAQKGVIAEVPTTGWYWSSSQLNVGLAWDQNFDIGGRVYNDKRVESSVRAVRAF